jgi:hypothetical protein
MDDIFEYRIDLKAERGALRASNPQIPKWIIICSQIIRQNRPSKGLRYRYYRQWD